MDQAPNASCHGATLAPNRLVARPNGFSLRSSEGSVLEMGEALPVSAQPPGFPLKPSIEGTQEPTKHPVASEDHAARGPRPRLQIAPGRRPNVTKERCKLAAGGRGGIPSDPQKPNRGLGTEASWPCSRRPDCMARRVQLHRPCSNLDVILPVFCKVIPQASRFHTRVCLVLRNRTPQNGFCCSFWCPFKTTKTV